MNGSRKIMRYFKMERRRLFVLFLVCGTLIVTAANAQDDGCISKKCHSTIGSEQWVHGPVGVGACTVCHTPIEGKDHGFTLALEKEELCFACHDESRDMMQESHLHTPVAKGECTGCHDPHQSEYRFTLKTDPKEMCFACHEATMFAGEHVHGPVGEGDCVACHSPHASAHANQLRSDPVQLCFDCHVERADIEENRHSHPPVAEDCAKCHDVHASANNNLLEQPSPALCFACHDTVATYTDVSSPHPPFNDGSCEECHNPHGSEQAALMWQPTAQLCFECHDEIEEFMVAQSFRHGPTQQDDCVACHNPHGSDHSRLLHKFFPDKFYVAYDESNYAMCFECHNGDIAREAETETLTDFRDGTQNLHFLHVNKQEKGRSCRACHQVHASSQERHIRLTVPYGKLNWELPVNFTATEHGGSCEVGCHSPKEYSRK